jgi:hypothetical protein
MKTMLSVVAVFGLCASAWAQGAPNAQPQEKTRCRKEKREGSC